MNKYTLYCETDGWVEVISEIEPTLCPIDGGHTIREHSIHISSENNVKMETVGEGLNTLPLAVLKQLKFKEIRSNTLRLVQEGGFWYDNAGNDTKHFPLELDSQFNLFGVEVKKNDGILPLKFHTVAFLDHEILTTAAQVDAFFTAAFLAKAAIYGLEEPLIVSVNAATTVAELDLVIDNR